MFLLEGTSMLWVLALQSTVLNLNQGLDIRLELLPGIGGVRFTPGCSKGKGLRVLCPTAQCFTDGCVGPAFGVAMRDCVQVKVRAFCPSLCPQAQIERMRLIFIPSHHVQTALPSPVVSSSCWRGTELPF